MTKTTNWSFAKYVGCGNDFIVFDDRDRRFPAHLSSLIQQLCHRQTGIGADGIILLQKDEEPSFFRMRIFNRDGSEAEMCGNGIRCLIKFLKSLGYSQSKYQIRTMKRDLQATCDEDEVSVEMGNPLHPRWNISISFKDHCFQWHYLDTGVPHAVTFTSHIEEFNLSEWGPFIRHHPYFAPQGTNVNIAEVLSPQELKLRTYERGVELETLACGTGATATALAASYCLGLTPPLTIYTRSGEQLTINFQLKEQTFSHVTMSGPANCVYKGEINLNY